MCKTGCSTSEKSLEAFEQGVFINESRVLQWLEEMAGLTCSRRSNLWHEGDMTEVVVAVVVDSSVGVAS